jgi:acetyl esterase/lipase
LIAKDKNHEFSAGCITFEPKARTVWHTHPKGQVLIVIDVPLVIFIHGGGWVGNDKYADMGYMPNTRKCDAQQWLCGGIN